MRKPVLNMLSKGILVLGTSLLLQLGVFGQGQPTAEEIELAEKAAALDAAIDRIQKLRGEVKAARGQVRALTEGLAVANAENVEISEAYQKLRVKVEALGPELLEKGDSGIRTKLLNAVSDLGIVQKENDRLANRLLSVTVAVMTYLSLDDETQRASLQAKLERELHAADVLLGFRMDSGQREVRGIESSQVVSIKKEWGLAVFDAGSASGVKIGTPLEIVRDDQIIATATVVNVRETISGAILTAPAGAQDLVEIRDGIRLAAEPNLQN